MSYKNMISIIIPTYNEADQIYKTINSVFEANKDAREKIEIIVVDGGSDDDTIAIAEQAGVNVIISKTKGRAAQMNEGAKVANGEILYFLHADSVPPKNFASQVIATYNDGASCGCFQLAFDYQHWFLKANCWFTRFDVNAIRFGDQSLFVLKDVFVKSGGFNESLWMMEDQEIIHRLKKYGKFKVMNDFVITSARKYLDNGVYRMQAIFFWIWLLYYLGFSQSYLLKQHRKLIRRYKL